MERILDRYIRDEISISRPLHKHRFPSQEGKSTLIALQTFVKRIRKTYKDKEICVTASIDIQSAFDNTSYESIVNALERKEVHVQTRNWINNMLRYRELISSLGHESLITAAFKGCPQGGVLSPILWNIVLMSCFLSWEILKNSMYRFLRMISLYTR